MSDFNASALLSNIKRIQPEVAARRDACSGALAREAHEGLERVLKQLVSLISSDDEDNQYEAEWLRHQTTSLLPDRIVEEELEDGEFLPDENYRDTTLNAGDLEGLRDLLIQLHKECDLRFISRYVRVRPVRKA
ncbi:hypothetical protein [Aureimonas ureilytica]|uniref:hypothetical protein n=1 Tax=Aureimonas ureilytica TaxID=401562 RepID=UPI000363A445|nr:hypothetical protein [Aureimonas ureilytica]